MECKFGLDMDLTVHLTFCISKFVCNVSRTSPPTVYLSRWYFSRHNSYKVDTLPALGHAFPLSCITTYSTYFCWGSTQ